MLIEANMRKKIKTIFKNEAEKNMKEMNNKCKENKKEITEKAAEKWNEFTKTAEFESRREKERKKDGKKWRRNEPFRFFSYMLHSYWELSLAKWACVHVNVNGIDASDRFGNAGALPV